MTMHNDFAVVDNVMYGEKVELDNDTDTWTVTVQRLEPPLLTINAVEIDTLDNAMWWCSKLTSKLHDMVEAIYDE